MAPSTVVSACLYRLHPFGLYLLSDIERAPAIFVVNLVINFVLIHTHKWWHSCESPSASGDCRHFDFTATLRPRYIYLLSMTLSYVFVLLSPESLILLRGMGVCYGLVGGLTIGLSLSIVPFQMGMMFSIHKQVGLFTVRGFFVLNCTSEEHFQVSSLYSGLGYLL